MNVRIYDSGRRKEITNFNLTKSQDGKSLKLNWKYSGNGDYWFVIYRSVDGNNMMTYKNIKSDQQSFTDTNLKKGIYQYALKAVYKDGGESQLLKSAATDFNPSGK
jgi:hypothetical protein